MRDEPEGWKKDYRADGFLVLPDLVDPTTLSILREGLEKISESPDSLPPELKGKIFLERDHVKNNPQWYAGVLTPKECGNSPRQIEDLALFGPAFAELICYPPLLDVLETLFDSSEFSFNYLIGRPKAARVGNVISVLYRALNCAGLKYKDSVRASLDNHSCTFSVLRLKRLHKTIDLRYCVGLNHKVGCPG